MLLGGAAVLFASGTSFAAPAATSQTAPTQTSVALPADQAPATADKVEATGFRYGPINAQDPEVRTQIKKLYRDQFDLEKATQARLTELTAALEAESDADFRFQIQKDMIRAKEDLQLQSMELGLEIARLNGDERRVADFENALDRLRNPEKYMPATHDPSIARERARQMGLEK
jgi:hypothetical protein